VIAITVHAGVVSVIEWIPDPVFDQRSDAIFASCFFEVVEWMSVMYSVSTSTRAVTFSARTR
jgi:hypothetical protein